MNIDQRIRGNVNNQLGYIHSIFKDYLSVKKDIDSLQFELRNEKPNIYISHNVLPIELARKAREFAQQIPFDNVNNDDIYIPKDNIFEESCGSFLRKCKESSDTVVPKQWIWERYHKEFYRATPLDLSVFINSPIFELIDLLESKWKKHLFELYGINMALKKNVWVLQRTPKGFCISSHDDGWKDRNIAFVYYLTPDDWSIEDGGQLHVEIKPNESISINPTFNSMVLWDMIDCKSPLHWVDKVEADDSRPRIALVGFWSSL